jgi:hypothetical protein
MKPTCPNTPLLSHPNVEFWAHCSPVVEGQKCRAHCKAGFVGAPVSICTNGSWQQPVGSCVMDQSICPPFPPFLPPNTASWNDCTSDHIEGSRCVATCAPGYKGESQGRDTHIHSCMHVACCVSAVAACLRMIGYIWTA